MTMRLKLMPIAACLFSAGVALGAAAQAAEPQGKSYHVMRMPQAGVVQAPLKTAGSMLYYGGPVLANVKTVAVIWSKGVNKMTAARIGPFLASIVNSTYLDQLAQYSTHLTGVNGHQGTNQTIGRGTYGGRFVITPNNKSKNLADADVQTELAQQIAAGVLPSQSLNTLYMIYFPANITITVDGLQSCSSFGAYHSASSASVIGSNLFYGVMPDCGGGFTQQTIVSSHEFAEATTDTIPTPGNQPAYPQAWNTSQGYEIGDLCEGNQTTLTAGKKVYAVQEEFDNATNACSTGKFTSP